MLFADNAEIHLPDSQDFWNFHACANSRTRPFLTSNMAWEQGYFIPSSPPSCLLLAAQKSMFAPMNNTTDRANHATFAANVRAVNLFILPSSCYVHPCTIFKIVVSLMWENLPIPIPLLCVVTSCIASFPGLPSFLSLAVLKSRKGPGIFSLLNEVRLEKIVDRILIVHGWKGLRTAWKVKLPGNIWLVTT